MDNLEQDILDALSSDFDTGFDQLHEKVNAARAERSALHYAHLGWLRGVSRKRLNEALNSLMKKGDITRDTRRAIINILGVSTLEMVDHFKKSDDRSRNLPA